MAKERHPAAFLVGAAIGGVIGGIVGLMNAPRAGAATRARVTERWQDVEKQPAQRITRADDEIHDRLGRGRRGHEGVETESIAVPGPART